MCRQHGFTRAESLPQGNCRFFMQQKQNDFKSSDFLGQMNFVFIRREVCKIKRNIPDEN